MAKAKYFKILISFIIALFISTTLIFPKQTQSQKIIPLNPANNAEKIETAPGQASKIYGLKNKRKFPREPRHGISAKVFKFELKTPQAQEINPVQSDIEFLKASQNPDGSWSENSLTATIETSATAQAFKKAESEESLEYEKAIDWFALSFPESSDYLAEKITNMYQAEIDASPLPEYLTSQINEHDLGFGFQKFYNSDALTSAKVLQAIFESNYQDPGDNPNYTLELVLTYLLNSQDINGSWEDSIFITNLVLQNLMPYQETPAIKQRIDLGLNYLKNLQNPNGTWQDDLLKTALSYDTLISYQIEPNYNQKSLDYLINNQDQDSFYKIAKKLSALAKPDLAVTNLESAPFLIPLEPMVVDISVKNLGYTKSMPINFAQAPSTFLLSIDDIERELDFSGCQDCPGTITLEPQEVFSFSIILKGFAFGQHSVKLKIDYNNIEFKKHNNELAKDLVFDDPEFTGPIPPAWAGASTGEEPGLIKIRWHVSEDPDTAYYAIYASTVSGIYDPYIPFDIVSSNVIGKNYILIEDLYDMPIYFTVVSLDASYIRGDYSMETWARIYGNPNNYAGTITGQVIDNNQEAVPNAWIEFYTFGGIQADIAGNYILNYYPGFYWTTASHASYTSQSKEVEIKAQDSIVYDFDLEIIDDGITPIPITGIEAQPGDNQIQIIWNQFQDISGDFKHFNIYRSNSPISTVEFLEPIDQLITDSQITLFIDQTIINGLNYYYAITAEDLSGNFDPIVDDAGPAKGNSKPQISNLFAEQTDNLVNISYDLFDQENSIVNISLEYWDGANWQNAQTASGQGQQLIGADKTASWDAKQDFPEFDSQTKIKIIANDSEAVESMGYAETEFFSLDTKNPTEPTADHEPITTEFSQTISGTKETNTAIYINSQEVVGLDAQTNWNYQIILQEGENNFNIIAQDSFSNASNILEFTIILDTVAPSRESEVNIEKLDLSLKLSWQDIIFDQAGNPEIIDHYEIHRANQANFVVSPDNKIAQTNNLEFTDNSPGIIGDIDNQYYYAVVAVDQAGNKAEQTERVGEYDYLLLSNNNLAALPLENDLSKASQLWSLIPNINSLSYWNAELQDYAPYPPEDFEVQTGNAYFIGVSQDIIWTVIGKVLNSIGPFELIKVHESTGVNTVTIPLNMTDITKASALWLEIPNIDGLFYWDAEAQGYEPYIPGIPVTDFDIFPGRAYYVGVTEDTIWNP